MPPPGHLRPLDGLRALSVLWVVFFHAGWYARFTLPIESWFALSFSPWMLPIWRGDFGVDLFFVLSGFLIAGMLLDEHRRNGRVALGLFYVRRLLRLWPALLFVVGIELLTDDPNRHMAWANALYVNDFVPVGTVALGWTWSLAIEEQFYIVCPWLLRAIFPLTLRARLAVMASLLVALIVVAACVVVHYEIRPWDAEVVGQFDMSRWGFAFDVFYDKPWMRAGALLTGVSAALLYRAPRVMGALAQGGSTVGTLTFGALVLMALATHWPLTFGQSRFVEVAYLATFRTVFAVGAAFVILVTLSAHPLGQTFAKPLSSRWLFPFSQLAYSAYLVNPMVTMFADRVLQIHVPPGTDPMRIYVPCDVIGTFVCAALIHVAIERPGMELRPVSVTAAAAIPAA